MSILNVCVEVIYHFVINCVLFAVFNTVLQRKMLTTEILASVLGAFMYVGLYYCNVYLPIIEIVNIIYLILFSYFVLKQTIAFHCLVCMFYNLCNNCFLLLIKSVLSSIENGQLFLDLLIESQVFKTIFLAIIIIVWYSFYVAFKSVLRDFVYNRNSMIAVFLLLFGGYAGYIYLIKMTYNAFSDEIPLKWFWC